MRSRLTSLLPGLATALFLLVTEAEAVERAWTFDVYLDDSKIGFHRFSLEESQNGELKLEAEAKFDVRFLFFNAFRYRHNIEETWSGNCLVELEARTDSNGKSTEVGGALTESGFLVEKGSQSSELEPCVMTFAYWNRAFLEQPKLLNPQTGEYVDVDVTAIGSGEREINGQTIEARGYKISSRNMQVTVWYSATGEWIALESPAKGGRTIRYELST